MTEFSTKTGIGFFGKVYKYEKIWQGWQNL